MKAIKWIIVIVLAGLFLAAGGSKILDPVAFAGSILRYRLIGEDLAWVAALWVPWMEVLAASGLFFRKWRKASCCLLIGLLCVFEVILLSALMRGLDIECGCFGTNAGSSLSFSLTRNLVLLALLLFLYQLKPTDGE